MYSRKKLALNFEINNTNSYIKTKLLNYDFEGKYNRKQDFFKT